ncbi:MAG: hypothetical protein M3R64_06610 [Pseudomonadota bacterium]|nr:hypothetical protein [Pseudomonadota bacterium]
MKTSILCVVASLAIAAPALAAGPFDGTWKVNVASAKLSTKPDVWAIKDGVYTCSTCTPAIRVAADGKPHGVPGHDYFDTMAVTVVNPTTVHYLYARSGKTVNDSTDTLAPGGQKLMASWTTSDNAKGETVKGKGVMARVSPAPAGAHAASGGWRRTNDVQLSDQVLTVKLAMAGNALTMTQPTGETYTATVGGAMAPIKGDPAHTMVKLTRSGPQTLVETDYRGGKPVSRFTMTPMPGGKTMKFVSTDLKANTTSEFAGIRQ